MKTHKICR